MAGSVLRLFEFRPVGAASAVDVRLRDEVAPSLCRRPGLAGCYLGRRAAAGSEDRLIATIWRSPDALEAAERSGAFEHEATLGGSPADVLGVTFEVGDGTEATPAVIRVFRGFAREGQLDEYVEQARLGTIDDIEADRGPIRLHLATVTPSSRYRPGRAGTGS